MGSGGLLNRLLGAAPEAKPAEVFSEDGGRPPCVVCPCTPHLTACGAFTDGEPPTVQYGPTVPSCADCVKVLDTGCLVCGCKPHEVCGLCQ